MIQKINFGSDESILTENDTGGLGRLVFHHPVGTFALTPASKILLKAITDQRSLLRGAGIDWGTGIGCQAILAARIDAVQTVYGLEISRANVETAARNAEENGVASKVRFLWADSYVPYGEAEKKEVQALKGKVDFILSNPPSSEGDDGFGFRRAVLSGAKEMLKKQGVIFLNVSFQYGAQRVRSLAGPGSGFRAMGVIASTDCVPFDLSRPDLLACLKTYAREEQNGGADYAFLPDESGATGTLNARAALERYEKCGVSPLTKWQTQLFRFEG